MHRHRRERRGEKGEGRGDRGERMVRTERREARGEEKGSEVEREGGYRQRGRGKDIVLELTHDLFCKRVC
jgi:hypothetical protein